MQMNFLGLYRIKERFNMDKSSNITYDFTKEMTIFIKGVAVMLLLLHHLMWQKIILPIDLFNTNLFELVTPLTKVCVDIFTILSGYGMYVSYKAREQSIVKFTENHLKKIFISYWYIYVPALFLSFLLHKDGNPVDIYGTGIKGGVCFLLDAVGLRNVFGELPTLNNTWWYLEVTIVCYIFFPLFILLLNKRLIMIGTLVITFIPIILYTVCFYTKGVILSTDRAIFYIFPFLVGMCMAKSNILKKIVKLCIEKSKLLVGTIMIAVLLVCMLLRTQITVLADIIYAIVVISFCIYIYVYAQNNIVKCVCCMGRHSMNIFFVHSFIYYYFKGISKIIYFIDNRLYSFVTLLILSLFASFVIEKVKYSLKKIKEYHNFKKILLF